MIRYLFILLFNLFCSVYFINILKYFQDDHYHYRIFNRYYYHYYLKRPYFIIVLIVILINNQLLLYISLSLIMVCLLIEYYKLKKFKVTKRIIRIMLLYLIYLIIIDISKYYIYLIAISLILMPLIIMTIFYIESHITKLINLYYYHKAKQKIKKYKPLIIGITGSCGKTSIKNYLYNCLKKEFIVFKSDKSYNTINGLSLTINQKLHSYQAILILEMGASHKNDIKTITKYFKPDISIITDILPQHLSTFKTMDALINEKLNIIRYMNANGLVIINGDNKNLKESNIDILTRNKIIRFGFENTNDYYPEEINIYNNGISFKLKDNIYTSKLIGRHNITNLLIVIIVLNYFKVEESKIKKYIEELENYENRLELKQMNKLTILNDSYNSNIVGFMSALEILSKYDKYKIIITPGIVEGGKEQGKINSKIACEIARICDFCYIVNNKNTPFFVSEFKNKKYDNYEIVKSFKSAFDLVKNEEAILLIENDLTDYYYLDIKRKEEK